MKLEIKFETDEGKVTGLKYDVKPDGLLDFIPQVINDFAQALEISDQEMVGNMAMGLGLAMQAVEAPLAE